MDHAVSVHGCVLKHRPVGEYDWLVTLLTAEKGKITAFARGARKPGTRLSGNVEPFSFGTFDLYPGKNSHVLTGAAIDRYFESFRQDLEQAAYGTFFLEVADYYMRENLEAAPFLNLLYVSLLALSEKHPDRENRLVRCAYEIRAMVTEGVFPGTERLLPLPQALIRAIGHIEQAPLKKLYSFTLRKDLTDELVRVTARLRNMVMDRKPNSLEMLGLYEKGE